MKTNLLYYGDNLDILRRDRDLPDGSVDLVYLDPPFNANRDFNVIFKDESGQNTDAQLVAFEDTWHWGPTAERIYAYLTNTSIHDGRIPDQVSAIVAALRVGIRENQMLAYLVEMAVRLVELHRVLSPYGSLYLHCDPTASHYLKVILDAVFGPQHFRSEIVWKRTSAHSSAKRWGPVHDVLLYYTKTDRYTWNPTYLPLPQETIDSWYNNVEEGTGRRFNRADLTAEGVRTGPSGAPWRGIDPSAKGRHWAIPGFVGDLVARLSTQDALEALDAASRIFWPKRAGGMPMVKRYVEESKGIPAQDVITDIYVNNISAERLGYPTQKPLALLERIVAASSNPNDIVLDPFCGCGTALVAAQKLGRRWVGIDITYLAIAVMRARLRDAFGLDQVEVVGQPTEVAGARELARSADGRYQFQWWALGLVDAKPVGGVEKKGADRGVDGVLTFTDKNARLERVLVSVKSGHVNAGMVQQLRGALEDEKAAIGLFVTLEEPTAPMKREAALAGVFHSELWNKDYARIQILTIRDLLEEHRKPDIPPFVLPTFPQAAEIKEDEHKDQAKLFA